MRKPHNYVVCDDENIFMTSLSFKSTLWLYLTVHISWNVSRVQQSILKKTVITQKGPLSPRGVTTLQQLRYMSTFAHMYTL